MECYQYILNNIISDMHNIESNYNAIYIIDRAEKML